MEKTLKATAKNQNVLIKTAGGFFGAIFLILALPFILTGTSKLPVVGLSIGLVLGFVGIAPFVSGDGIAGSPIGLIITAIIMMIVSLLCIAGFICSFKPALFKGSHGDSTRV